MRTYEDLQNEIHRNYEEICRLKELNCDLRIEQIRYLRRNNIGAYDMGETK